MRYAFVIRASLKKCMASNRIFINIYFIQINKTGQYVFAVISFKTFDQRQIRSYISASRVVLRDRSLRFVRIFVKIYRIRISQLIDVFKSEFGQATIKRQVIKKTGIKFTTTPAATLLILEKGFAPSQSLREVLLQGSIEIRELLSLIDEIFVLLLLFEKIAGKELTFFFFVAAKLEGGGIGRPKEVLA